MAPTVVKPTHCTVSLTVVVCDSVPDVAVTLGVVVPGGVPIGALTITHAATQTLIGA